VIYAEYFSRSHLPLDIGGARGECGKSSIARYCFLIIRRRPFETFFQRVTDNNNNNNDEKKKKIKTKRQPTRILYDIELGRVKMKNVFLCILLFFRGKGATYIIGVDILQIGIGHGRG